MRTTSCCNASYFRYDKLLGKRLLYIGTDRDTDVVRITKWNSLTIHVKVTCVFSIRVFSVFLVKCSH